MLIILWSGDVFFLFEVALLFFFFFAFLSLHFEIKS